MRRGTYLALARSGNVRGHLGHLNVPSISDMGAMSSAIVRGTRGPGRKRTQGLDIGPFIDSEDVAVSEKGDIEVWFPLSSSNEGLERSGSGESAERERSRTIPSSATYWLGSETNSARSR
jgi:hypothetical protein